MKISIVFSTSAGLFNANGVYSIGKKLIQKRYKLIDMETFEERMNSLKCMDEGTSLSVDKSMGKSFQIHENCILCTRYDVWMWRR